MIGNYFFLTRSYIDDFFQVLGRLKGVDEF